MDAAAEKMRAEGLPDVAVETFARYRSRLAAGDRGMLPESEIEPVAELPDAEQLPTTPPAPRRRFDRAVVIKLNGGLGTEHGHDPGQVAARGQGRADVPRHHRPPGPRPARARRRARAARADEQLRHARRLAGRAASATRTSRSTACRSTSSQGKVPKLRADDLEPVEWPADPKLEWAPPGHGDLYPSLVGLGDARRAARARLSSTPSCRTRTTSAPRSTRASSPGSRARGCRS